MPARARVAAMPGPIVPKPMTAAFFISTLRLQARAQDFDFW